MNRDPQKIVPDASNKFDTCAEPQDVLYSDFAGDESSEELGFGAFILSITEILFESDVKGEENGNDTTD